MMRSRWLILFLVVLSFVAQAAVPLEVQRMQAKSPQGKQQAKSKITPPVLDSDREAMPSKPPRVHIVFPKPGMVKTAHHVRKPRRIDRTTIYPGSLRKNVKRIASKFGWSRVVWNVPYDFNWVGTTRISAGSLAGLLGQMLEDYPLQAVFYRGNHVLVIVPRTLRP